jgi:RNA polymerase sigma-70 factor (ECF subfamily)
MADRRPAAASDAPEALVERALAGEEGAFARIVRKHRARMVRVALVVTGDLAGAEEAAAAAWPVAWSRLGRLREPERLEPWLCGAAAEEASRVVRARARLADAGAACDGEAPADGDADRNAAATGDDRPPTTPGASAVAEDRDGPAPTDPELAALLEVLPPGDRVLLALRHVAGMTPDELGTAVGLAPAAALHRCRALAAELLPGEATADEVDAEDHLAERIRALVDRPVAPVDIDAVARRANVTRNDHRYRVISLVIAIVLAIVVLAIPYLGERRTLPGLLPGAPTSVPAPPAATPSPVPTPTSTPPSSPEG